MTTHSIEFYKLSDKQPERGQWIHWIKEGDIFCGYQILTGDVYIYWEDDNNNLVPYGEGVNPDPARYQKRYYGWDISYLERLDSNTLWCAAKDVDTALENAARIND